MSIKMFSRLICLALATFTIVAAAPRTQDGTQELRDIVVVKDISEFAHNHPGLHLEPMNKNVGKARDNSVRYTLGGRVNDDRLVAQGADVFSYPARKDIAIQLTYPESGTGAIVTFVDIVCQQDNFDGNAYVVAGGIGQRFISIVLEASQTENFAYTAQYYGVN